MALCPHCGKPWSPTKAISPEIREQVLELHRQGFSARDIQEKLAVSFSSAARIVREARTPKPEGKDEGSDS
jgi:transposase-like protein